MTLTGGRNTATPPHTRRICTIAVPWDSELRMAVCAGAAGALLWALPAQAAENTSALLQQLSAQLKQDQLQIEALRRQIDALQNRIDQTPVIPPGPPPPDARNVLVTQQP